MKKNCVVIRCIILAFLGIIPLQPSLAIRCFECISRLGPGESSACLTGDRNIIRRVRCMGPSVCAAYEYQSVIPGTPTTTHITRGCQSTRYGETCEDIFNELRSNGEVLPGQHTCTTCNSDLCNAAHSVNVLFVVVLAMSFVPIVNVVLS